MHNRTHRKDTAMPTYADRDAPTHEITSRQTCCHISTYKDTETDNAHSLQRDSTHTDSQLHIGLYCRSTA